MCDPTFEDCETAVVDVIDVEATGEEEILVAEDGWSPSKLALDANEVIFGLACLGGFVQGYFMYDWYPKNVKDNNTMFPDRDPNPITYTDNENEEWALGTKEIRAWNLASRINIVWYGVSLLSWMVNLILDNKGGRLHFVSQQVRRLSWFAVLAQVTAAVRINTSYARSGSWFANAVVDGKDVGSTHVNVDERLWLFNPANIDIGEFDSTDVDSLSHQQTNWISILVIASAMAFAAPALSEKYENAVAYAETAGNEEEAAEPEPEADIAEAEETEEIPAF